MTQEDIDCAIDVVNDWGKYKDLGEAAKIIARHRTTALAETQT